MQRDRRYKKNLNVHDKKEIGGISCNNQSACNCASANEVDREEEAKREKQITESRRKKNKRQDSERY
jgi:hypothetical protein